MFKEIFIKLCSERNLSPSFVCREVGITPATYSGWDENSVPRKTTLLKIAEYFGVSTAYLLGDKVKENTPSSGRGVRIPVYGAVAAGIPIEAITDIEDYEEISEELAKKGEYIALKIKGRSMLPDFRNGDTVIVRLQDDVESGEIAIVMVNGGEATCKKFVKKANGVVLQSFNPAYEPMYFSAQEVTELPLCIIGRVVELRAKF